MTMGAMSPRSTAPYQTLESSPRVTSPMTEAVEAMNAVGWIACNASLLVLRWREEHLGPGLDRRAILQGGMPRYGPDEIPYLALVRGIVGRPEAADIYRAALGRYLDPEERRPGRCPCVGGYGYKRRVDRLGALVEAGAIDVVARTRNALGVCPYLSPGGGCRRTQLSELGGE